MGAQKVWGSGWGGCGFGGMRGLRMKVGDRVSFFLFKDLQGHLENRVPGLQCRETNPEPQKLTASRLTSARYWCKAP